MLIPRVALTGTSSASPITSPAISLLVYNTATAGDVTPGYYYWDGSAWQRFIAGVTNNVTGSGTTNVLPKWTSASGLGDSRIFDDGTNIGIGTASPAANVEIRGNTVKVGSNNDDAHSWFPYSDGNVYITGDVDGTGDGDIIFRGFTGPSSYSEKVRVKGTSGDVGIGTSNPAGYRLNISNTGGDYILHLGSDFGLLGDDRLNLIKFGSDGDYQILHEASGALGRNTIGLHASSSDAIGFYSSGWDPLFEVAGGTGQSYFKGNMGIGTTSPAQALEIYRDNQDVGIRFHDPGNYHYAIGIDQSDGGKFKINYGSGIGDNSHFSMTTGGNVGIGTASPAYNLDVSGNTRTTGDFYGDIHVDDTRNVNDPPTTFDKEVAFDFKNRSVVGVPGSGTYSGMMTIAPWGDNSGDASHQLNFNEGGLYWRQGQPDAGSWGSWDRIVTESLADGDYIQNQFSGEQSANFWISGHGRMDILSFNGIGGNSGVGNQDYAIYQEDGAWSSPYPDLIIAWHTGIRIGGHKNYNGTRFYNDSPERSGAAQIFSVGDGDDYVRTYQRHYSPIYYDLNDGGYYLDPNSTSQAALRIRGGALHGPNPTWGAYLLVGGDGRQGYIDNSSTASVSATNGNLHLDAASGYDTYINYYDGNNIHFGRGNNSDRAYMDGNGLYLYDGWFRTHGNTGWYNQTHGGGIYMTDNYWVRTYNNRSFYSGSGEIRSDNSFRMIHSSPTVYFRDTDHNSYMIHVNSDRMYFLHGGDNTYSWNGNRPLTIYQGNKVGINNDSPSYELHVTGRIRTNAINETSDVRLKKNISTLNDALHKVNSLRGVTYEWRKDEYPEMILGEGVQYGLIAQEVETILPEIISTDEDGYKSIEYSHLVPVLIEGMKEQQTQIEQLKNELQLLKSRQNVIPVKK